MKNTATKSNRASRNLPAIFAVGGSLAALPVSALELGDITVQSRLGQPLRASIAYALGPNEQIGNYCVTMRPGASVSGLPSIGTTAVSVANGVILLSGSTPVREPMVSAHVVVNCPYSAHLSREYMLFIDPLSPAYDQQTVTQQASPASEPVVVEPVAVAPSSFNRPVASPEPRPAISTRAKDLQTSTRYTVQRGDTLSVIAQRIENRGIGLWAAVDQIFAANPDAFVNNDRNRLKAGSVLSIPDFGGNAAVIATPATATARTNAETVVVEQTTTAPAADSSATETNSSTPADAAAAAIAAYDTSVNDSQTPVIIGDTAQSDVIFDADVEGPSSSSASPNVPTAIVVPSDAASDGIATKSWLMWLGGGGIAIILGLLLFGRRFGNSATPVPVAATQNFGRRQSDTETTDTENVEAMGVDFDLSDDSPTEENLALDADLIVGTGLASGSGDSAVHEFGFANAVEVDVELPFEPVANATEQTDNLPSLPTDEFAILESEVLPVDSDDDYDMSVIVDATKMPQPEDVTEQDLRAIEVTPDDDTLIAQNYTISKEIDYQVLEQDYEDEFTATQALNLEIARAAAELTENSDDGTSDADDDYTEALPLATVTELDVTTQMAAQNDDVADDDDPTGVNEEITLSTSADEETVEMPVESGKAS